MIQNHVERAGFKT